MMNQGQIGKQQTGYKRREQRPKSENPKDEKPMIVKNRKQAGTMTKPYMPMRTSSEEKAEHE
jgi:hypothetical protein